MPNCYHCQKEIHFDPDVKSKNGKYIPLSGKTGTTKHSCTAKPFNKETRRQWWWSQQQQYQHQQRQHQHQQQQQRWRNTTTTVSERMRKYLAVLGLPPFCESIDEVKQAYRRLALLYHPDRSKDASTAGKFIESNDAYEKCMEALT